MNSFFSILIPVYKVEKTLGKYVSSINNQRFAIINDRFYA